MELRLTPSVGRSISIESLSDPEDHIIVTVRAPDALAAIALTDQEAETLARELFALSGRPI